MELLRRKIYPVSEGFYKGDDLHRSFTYYTQSLNGYSERWQEIAKDLNSLTPPVVMGLVLPRRKLVWSTEAPAHMVLEKAVQAEHWDAKIESYYGMHVVKPFLTIYTDDLDLQIDFKNYLLRSGLVPGLLQVEASTFKGQRQQLI